MRHISRREALGAMGTVSLGALLAACSGGGPTEVVTSTSLATNDGTSATVEPQTDSGPSLRAMFDDAATCTLTPEQTEGPFYFDVDSIRSDIREDREGATLRLGVRVQAATSCVAVANAVVDIWHCDAGGLYSGFESASQGGAFTGGPSDEETYLRGAQVTDGDGIVQFRTIYPGWYTGRTVHIHAKAHLDRATSLTTQLDFADEMTDQAYAASPYVERGQRTTANASDGIFDAATVLTVQPQGEGFLGLITIGIDE